MEKNIGNDQGNFLARVIKIAKSTAAMVFLVTIVITLVVHALTQNFYTVYNIGTLIRQVSFVIIVAFGQTLVLISGGIDLSVASIAIICSMVAAELMMKLGLDPYLSLIIAIMLGFGLGAINGIIIHKLNLNPFIVTLASSSIFSGIVYVITRGMPIIHIPAKVTIIGQGLLFKAIPYPALFMLGIFIILLIISRYTVFGRHIYAIGGNEQAANIVGVRVGRIKILVYALSGLLAGFAGVLITLRLGSSQVSIGANWVFPSVTAAILGGTSLKGGIGGVGGTIIGGLLMGVIYTSITLLGISSYWELIVTGGVIIIAVAIDAIRQKNQSNL